MTQGGTNLTAKGSVAGESRVTTYIGATTGIGEVVMASLKAMQTMQTLMAAKVTQVTELIAGFSCSLEGIETHRDQASGRIGEN